MVIITVATVVGNSAVMVALWRVRRAPSHYPLISLVTADLLVGLLVQPLAALRELYVFNLSDFPSDRIICSCWSIMDVLCCTASILSLCVLGWERWSGITNPLARARRAKRAKLVAGLVWPLAAVIAIPNALVRSHKHFHPGELEKACEVNTNTGYVFFSVTLSFYLPAVVMLMMYCFILRALSAPPPVRAHRGRPSNNSRGKAMSSESTTQPGPSTDNNQNTVASFISRQRRATRIIVMLMTLFFVCWTPYFVMLPLDSLYDCVYDSGWLWCTWLGYINSSLNPLVYAVSSPSVRSALRSSLTSSGRNDMGLTRRN
ncbi:5-hydroxytryptamine receptor 1 [Danaus plexippus plexippus]|uniref:5-hydroxytryptamine receptor 1 n=1 Tax=Danaus plexippus plexippus TaxID=278856 RepID=A0A212EGU3_DANPL|nr:5-hydroxytryptamine receptor 1 [Danaus plexippus plexippus]